MEKIENDLKQKYYYHYLLNRKIEVQQKLQCFDS